MKRTIFTLVLAAGVLLAHGVSPRPVAGQSGIGLPGGSTPDPVTLETLDGEPVDLGDYMGDKPMLLEFWATWCPLCEELEPTVHAAHEAYGDEVEFFIVAVGVNQSPGSIRRHLEDEPMVGRMVWDGEGRAVRAFRAPGTSYVVVLDADGAVTYTGAGADQDLEAALEAVAGG